MNCLLSLKRDRDRYREAAERWRELALGFEAKALELQVTARSLEVVNRAQALHIKELRAITSEAIQRAEHGRYAEDPRS